MKTKPNLDLKSSSFKTKRQEYAKSEIEITKRLDIIDDLTPEAIKKRQVDFAKEALEIWNLNIS